MLPDLDSDWREDSVSLIDRPGTCVYFNGRPLTRHDFCFMNVIFAPPTNKNTKRLPPTNTIEASSHDAATERLQGGYRIIIVP